MAQSKLDFPQIIKSVYDEASESLRTTGGGSGGGTVQVENVPNGNLNVIDQAQLVPAQYDDIELIYIAGGPGDGQVGTAIYSLSGTTIATLTLQYDAQNRLTKVTRS